MRFFPTRHIRPRTRSPSTHHRTTSGRGSCRWAIGAVGLYSHDWLDRVFGVLDRPSANEVLPAFQQLAVGDKIRLGPREELTVAALDEQRVLALSYSAHGFEWVWQFGLYPLDEHRTRLVTRGTERFANTFSRLGVHAGHGTGGFRDDTADAARCEAARRSAEGGTLWRD